MNQLQLTVREIRLFREEAQEQNDRALVDTCNDALDGDAHARTYCAALIAAARSRAAGRITGNVFV